MPATWRCAEYQARHQGLCSGYRNSGEVLCVEHSGRSGDSLRLLFAVVGVETVRFGDSYDNIMYRITQVKLPSEEVSHARSAVERLSAQQALLCQRTGLYGYIGREYLTREQGLSARVYETESLGISCLYPATSSS